MKHVLILLCLMLGTCFLRAEQTPIVAAVELTGVDKSLSAFVVARLQPVSHMPFESALIPQLQDAIANALKEKGFWFAKVGKPEIMPLEEYALKLVFAVETGPVAVISRLGFAGNRYFSEAKLRQLLYLGNETNLPLEGLSRLQAQILDLYTSRGYLFARVQTDSLVLTDTGIAAWLRIEEGKPLSVRKYRFSGNKVTSANTLLKVSGLGSARQIIPAVLSQAEGNLLRKPYIKSCHITPLDEQTLDIAIEEGNMSRAEGLLGLSTNQLNQKNSLSGYLKLDFLNLWGTDRALNLVWKQLKAGNQSVSLTYHESGLSRLPAAADLILTRTEQDSQWISLKAQFSAYYQTLFQKSGLAYQTETLTPAAQSSALTETVRYQRVEAFWNYQQLDYSPNPSQGYAASLKYGLQNKSSGSCQKTKPVSEFDVETFIPLHKRITGALALHGRQILDRHATVYEQYKMGGFQSLRGYYEDEFASWRLGWLNTELRYLLSRDTRVYLLLDEGVFASSDNDYKYDLWAVGLGISIRTKIGIMRINYALPYRDKRFANMGSGLIHLGLDSYF